MSKAQELFEKLTEDGFDEKQVKEAMCDGEYLEKAGIDQDTADELFNILWEEGV